MTSNSGFLSSRVLYPYHEVMVLSVFLIFFVIWLGQPVKSSDNEGYYLKFILSFIGQVVFFGIDILLLLYINSFYPLVDKIRKVGRLLIFPLIFFGFSQVCFLFGKSLNFLIIFHLVLAIFLSHHRRENWTIPLIYLSLVVSPIGSFMGLDPIWGSSFSFFNMSILLRGDQFVILGLIALFYLVTKNRNYFMRRAKIRV